MQGVHRFLTGFDVTSDEVPTIGVHQPFGVAVHEQHAPVPDKHRARDGDGHAASLPDQRRNTGHLQDGCSQRVSKNPNRQSGTDGSGVRSPLRNCGPAEWSSDGDL